jgi:hypothetical protein
VLAVDGFTEHMRIVASETSYLLLPAYPDLLTLLEPILFLIHLYQCILYTAILVLLFYMEDRWAYMIGMLASVVWLAMAYTSGILGRAVERLLALRTVSLPVNLGGLLALVTALLAVLMIAFCGRHWKKEYSGLGKTRSTFLVSLGIVLAYYGILLRWFWDMIPNA